MGRQRSPSTANGRHKIRFCATNIVIDSRDPDSTGEACVHLKDLWVFGISPTKDAKSLTLHRTSSRRWEVVERINIPLGIERVDCIVRGEDGGDIGFVCLGKFTKSQSEQAQTAEINTLDETLGLTISWVPLETLPIEALDREFDGRDGRYFLTFGATASPAAVTQVALVLWEVIKHTPDGHPRLQTRPSFLRLVLMGYFYRVGDLPDVDKSVKALENSVLTTPRGHINNSESISSTRKAAIIVQEGDAGFLRNIGSTLLAGSSYFFEGISLLRKAVSISLHNHPLGYMRTSFDDLPMHGSDLGWRIMDISKALEDTALTQGVAQECTPRGEGIWEANPGGAWGDTTCSHLDLGMEWESLLEAAREIPGFKSFLRPTSFGSLSQNLPESGAVVTINVHQDQCDAICLLADLGEPLHIPLPSFSYNKASSYRDSLWTQVREEGLRVRGGVPDRAVVKFVPVRDDAIVTVLRSVWIEVAKPILDALAIMKFDASSTDHPPRIWWCPTGPLSFLPLHAAGIYSNTESESILDYVVSSYTPTVSSLTDIVKKSHFSDPSVSGLFLTSQPDAPGASSIPGTTREIRGIIGRAENYGVRMLNVEGSDLTVDDCLAYMENFSSIHLACHAFQNAAEPLKSRFLFHNGSLDLKRIMQRNLKNADLAFLSACQTSTGDQTLANESIHLAGGMLSAGYRRVVGTVWSIGDEDASNVADDFYQFLLDGTGSEDGGFDGALSAYALHDATQRLRKRLGNSKESLFAWVPFVHFGY